MFAQHVGVEAMDECAAVVARLQDAVVFELNQGLLHGHPAQSEGSGDLIAVHPITGPQPASEKQVEDMRNDQVLLFDPIAFGHRPLRAVPDTFLRQSSRFFGADLGESQVTRL